MNATPPTDPEGERLFIEQLKAEQKRRLDEKVANGEVALVTFDWPVVVGCPESADAAIEQAKAQKIVELRAAGDQRPVHFEWPSFVPPGQEPDPISVIVTGVPRAGRD
jgi:hypothetical protein